MDQPTQPLSDSQKAAVASVASAFSGSAGGSQYSDAQKAAIANVSSQFPGNVPSLQPTPTIVSSKDMSGGFASNSSQLNGLTTPTPTSTPDPNAPATTTTPDAMKPGVTGTGMQTAVDKGAAAGAGSGSTPTITSGDPIYDALQQWQADQTTKAQADAAQQKQDIQDRLKTSIANNDAQAAATITGITNTYSSLIDTQTRINNMNIARTKAYGLGGFDALAAPVEFTNAVSLRETDALDVIKKLDNERDDLIAKATTARDTGDAALLQTSMDNIQKVTDNLRTNLSDLQKQVTDRATLLQKVEDDQKAKQKENAQALLAAAFTQYGDAYNKTADNASKVSVVGSTSWRRGAVR